MNQLCHKFRQPTAVFLCPAIFDFDVLALYIACPLQSLAESAQTGGVSFRRRGGKKPDDRN